VYIYLKDNFDKFHPNPVWNGGALGFLKEARPNKKCKNKNNKKAQLTQGLCAIVPSFQDGRQLPSWILSNR